ncbi:hypothetical protein [Hoeflea prorocentri]|uniref:DUF2125 domain-containing protein n=1 Tax=Hoeflea prorocentri TaxID=1922333 RepID=A0A9X3UGM0_9HYPH|nr:hypothetical protein [Hoeflea prorocentri]MCY6380347.1 hypothetical protein [Hoeflea prorocentri]MDA5398147.1 hypothetical protein [Hoeflea prorocentri]
MKKIIVSSFCLLVAGAQPGFAQDAGQEALDDWLQSYRDLGATASYETVHTSGDTLTVKGLEVSYSTTFTMPDSDAEDGDQTVSLSMSWKSPELTAQNLRANAGGYAADSLTLSNGSTIAAALDTEDEGGLKVNGTIDGYVVTDGRWPRLPRIAEDPERPFSRWLPLMQTVVQISYKEERAEQISFDISAGEAGDEFTMTTLIEDYAALDMSNGRLAEYGTGKISQETKVSGEGDDEDFTQTTTMASSRTTGLDFGAMLALFDPQMRGSEEYRTLIETSSVNGYREKSDFYSLIVDRSGYEDVAVRAPRTDLLAFLDTLATGEEPEVSALVLSVIDIYRSFAVGRMFADGLSVGYDMPPEAGSGQVGQILLEDLSADGLGEFSISSVSFDLGSEGAFDLGRFFIGDIEFPPFDPVETFLSDLDNLDDPDPLVVARLFTPRSVVMELAGLSVTGAMPQGDISLGRYFMELETTVPPMPTFVEIATEGLAIPIAALDDDEAIAAFRAAGIDTLRLDEKIRLRWDASTEDLIVENIVVELGDVGKVRASARFGGLTRLVMENPTSYQALIATLNVKDFELELINEGGFETAIALMAEDADVSENLMAELLLEQLRQALTVVDNDAFTDMVLSAAETFFDEPRNLSLTISPDTPVAVSQIAAGAMTAPQMLPDLLGATVEANR